MLTPPLSVNARGRSEELLRELREKKSFEEDKEWKKKEGYFNIKDSKI